MTKPLDSTEGDQMSKQSVEWQALMEALNAATALKLERIVLCFPGGKARNFCGICRKGAVSYRVSFTSP
ncbi:hypothetical protein Hanom_Chr00s184184g01832721 [Helianthus anomalus]